MTSPNVSTDVGGMGTARAHFEHTSSSFSSQLSSVNSQMAALQASWAGQASNQFNVAMDQWEAYFRTIIQALNGMVGTMGGNANLYQSQEESAAGVAQNFASALPGV
jgi:WXG100 family type VII secretion target